MDKEVDEFTSCPVCFEDYQERGDHVPRLLPCSHTLCDKCVSELMDGNKITCPQDRQTSQADFETRKFPQNNYILKQIRDGKERGYKKCENHGRDINLFCRNEACQQELCSLCLTENHKKHDIVDLLSIKEAKLAEIGKEVEQGKKKLKNYGDKMNRVRQEANEELSKALTEVNTKTEEVSALLDERLSQIDNVLSVMTNIKESLSMETTYAEMASSQTIIRKEILNLTKIIKRPVPIFRFKPPREDKCVGHSFETNHPQQCECPEGGRFFCVLFGLSIASVVLQILFMSFLKPGQSLPSPIRLDHVSSQAHIIIQTDVPTCRNNIEKSLPTLMSECFSTMFPDRIITHQDGDDPRIIVFYETQRSGDSSKVELFTADCRTWKRSCTLSEKDSGMSIGITWDMHEYSEDPQQTKFTTTVKCDAVESSFCMIRGNSLYTIHNIFFNLVQEKVR